LSSNSHKQKRITKLANVCRYNTGLFVFFKVLEKPLVRIVENKKWGIKHQLVEVLVADETATIILILWNEDAEMIEEGNSYFMEEAYISVHDKCMKLCKSRRGVLKLSSSEIQSINKERNMSLPFIGKETITEPNTGSIRTLDGIPPSRFRKYCGHKDF